MKDNLFEMLLTLFERSLAQIQKSQKSVEDKSLDLSTEDENLKADENSLPLKSARQASIRICTYEEQMKLTKASYQFLMRLRLWEVIDANTFESVMHQLHISDSRIVTLQETKWTIRNILANTLNETQLAFLDLVLYQKEDNLAIQ
ncbi:MAG: DUF494 family protein [Legionella sp.]|jgi:Smg protein